MISYDPDDAVAHLAANDVQLAALIAAAGPFRLEVRSSRTIFDVLLRSIVYQQLSDRAAGTIYSRVVQVAQTPADFLRTEPEALRAAGLSAAKTRAAVDLAMRTVSGELPTLEKLKKMSDDEIVDHLTVVRGVGPWTVQMLLIFHLGRPDVLPVTDLGVKKGFMFTYGMDELPSPETLLAQGERWRPYRSVAAWYMWRAVDLKTGTPPPAL